MVGKGDSPNGRNFDRDFVFRIRVKALHYWIRKGNPGKAAQAARDAFHLAKCKLRYRPLES